MKSRIDGKPVTPGQAQYVLERLIRERRITRSDVARLVGEMHREIQELEDRLATLQQAAASQQRTGNGASTRRPTPALARSRKVQGEYMGLIRHLTGSARTRIKKLAAERGREAAIQAMRARSPSVS